MARVYLGLGSNLGDRAHSIQVALERLKEKIRLDRISALYETEPVGLTDQAWFLNLVCSGETDLAPEALLDFAKTIEAEMGRELEAPRFSARPIDIDVLFYDGMIVNTPRLEIPHPRLHERGFTLVPLSEIAPTLTHPVLGLTIRELLDNAPPLEKVRLYDIKDEKANS